MRDSASAAQAAGIVVVAAGHGGAPVPWRPGPPLTAATANHGQSDSVHSQSSGGVASSIRFQSSNPPTLVTGLPEDHTGKKGHGLKDTIRFEDAQHDNAVTRVETSC